MHIEYVAEKRSGRFPVDAKEQEGEEISTGYSSHAASNCIYSLGSKPSRQAKKERTRAACSNSRLQNCRGRKRFSLPGFHPSRSIPHLAPRIEKPESVVHPATRGPWRKPRGTEGERARGSNENVEFR